MTPTPGTVQPHRMNAIKIAVAAAAIAIPAFAFAQPAMTPEAALAQAARYTVKVSAFSSIGVNQDDGVSANGAGFLIDRQRGWLLTNAHVATRSPVVLKVAFKDKPEVGAKRIHVDPLIDMAIIQIDPKDIPETALEAQLECSGLPAIGTPVAAFGHPWGLNFTASRGIVSGVPWLFPQEQVQTDAAVNHGNSGGPLINLNDGKVVGLNASTYNPDADKEKTGTTISLAEPIPAICRIVELLKAHQDARLKMLPVALATGVDDHRPRVARSIDTAALFLPGDLIVGVNGTDGVRNASDLASRLRGDANTATITVLRGDKRVNVTTTLRVQPDPLAAKYLDVSGLLIGRQWRLDDFEDNPSAGGLIVDFVTPGTLSEDTQATGFRNRIVSVDGKTYSDVETLRADLAKKPADAQIEFITAQYSFDAAFLRRYRHFTLPRGDLKIVSMQ